jgi:hypothetical protein
MLELVRDLIEYAYRGVIVEYATFNLAGHSNPRIAQIYQVESIIWPNMQCIHPHCPMLLLSNQIADELNEFFKAEE